MEEFARTLHELPWWMWIIIGAACFPLAIVLLLISESCRNDS